MALRGETIIFVPKPSDLTYVEAMNQLRAWLDYKKVQPADFKIITGLKTGFEIGFSSEPDAQMFELFEWRA